MKFLADMGISPHTVAWLTTNGYQALHLVERRLERLPDVEILEMARSEGFILLTHDLGFGELIAASSAHLPSVITFRLHSMRPEIVNAYLERILTDHREPLMRGAFLSVNDRVVRVRLLPIKAEAF